MPFGCNCDVLLPIGSCAPFANHADVTRAISALSQCVSGTVALSTDPVASPAAALAEAFPGGFTVDCEPDVLFIHRPDGAHYVSLDQGSSWIDMGGTAGAASSVQVNNTLNNSGITLTPGAVVVWDYTTDNAVTTTTTENDVGVAGVWSETTLAGLDGVFVNRGLASVQTSAAVSKGDILVTGNVAGKAVRYDGTYLLQGVIGVALEDLPGAGTVLAFVDAEYGLAKAYFQINTEAYVATHTGQSWVDIDNTNLNLTITTSGRPVKITFQGRLGESASSASATAMVDVAVDGVRQGPDPRGLYSSAGPWTTSNGPLELYLEYIVDNLAPGPHTFVPQWRGSDSDSALTFGAIYSASASRSSGVAVLFRVEEI